MWLAQETQDPAACAHVVVPQNAATACRTKLLLDASDMHDTLTQENACTPMYTVLQAVMCRRFVCLSEYVWLCSQPLQMPHNTLNVVSATQQPNGMHRCYSIYAALSWRTRWRRHRKRCQCVYLSTASCSQLFRLQRSLLTLVPGSHAEGTWTARPSYIALIAKR